MLSEKGKVRRDMLKFLFVGGGAFVLGKLFGSAMELFTEEKPILEKNLENFKLVETERRLSLFDKSGEAILEVDKDGI